MGIIDLGISYPAMIIKLSKKSTAKKKIREAAEEKRQALGFQISLVNTFSVACPVVMGNDW